MVCACYSGFFMFLAFIQSELEIEQLSDRKSSHLEKSPTNN